MDRTGKYHAIKVDTQKCIGCTHCMKICPTEAIRIKDGVATINPLRCVDCGNCLRACPVNAFCVEHDGLEQLEKYKLRVALIPAVMIGQFPEVYTEGKIYEALLKLGFTHVREVEQPISVLIDGIKEEVAKATDKPVISSFCPAIVRLIRAKGDKILNAGIGFGTSLYNGTGYSTTIPPISASLEFIINDDLLDDGNAALGIGGYAGLVGSKYSYGSISYNYEWKYTSFVLGARGYFHYNFLENLDTYTGLMLGYNIVSVNEDSNYIGSDYKTNTSAPVASWFVGARYYFNDNLAGMAELGYGVAYLNLGIAYKF